MFRPLVDADLGQAGVIDDLSNGYNVGIDKKIESVAVAANLSSFSV